MPNTTQQRQIQRPARAVNDDVFDPYAATIVFRDQHAERLMRSFAFIVSITAQLKQITEATALQPGRQTQGDCLVVQQVARLNEACRKFIRTVGADLPLASSRPMRKVVLKASIPSDLIPLRDALEIIDTALSACLEAESLMSPDEPQRKRLRRARFEYRATAISALNKVAQEKKEARNVLTKKAAADGR